jgi:chloride channel protein, CIC family
MRSPLTGIVFTLELTHAWNDLTPLLVASVSAYLLSALLLKRSVLTEKIARRGLHLTREYSTDPLETFFASEVMTTDPVALSAYDDADPASPPAVVARADQTLREVAIAFAVGGTTVAPVMDPANPGRLVGVISLEQLLHARRTDHHEEHHRERHLSLPGKQSVSLR